MRYRTMDLFHGKQSNTFKKLLQIESLGFHGDMHLVIIRLPNSWVLKLMTRALLLSLIIISLPWLNVQFGDLMASKIGTFDSGVALNSSPIHLFPLLYRDFENEGFLKTGDRILLLTNEGSSLKTNRIANDYNLDMISHSDFKLQTAIPDETYDFMFVHDFSKASDFIGRTLKTSGGVVVLLLADISGPPFQKPSNYKIIYLRRRFGYTTMAMRKMYNVVNQDQHLSDTRRRLCGMAPESKKAALSNLEDVLLEPPRAASGKSTRYLKRTKYLPDLINDSLESYHRRVFIDVGFWETNDASNDVSWFLKHYPTRNTKFDMYKIDAVAEESLSSKKAPQIGISDWLRRNVEEDEYVVMKAEAEVVEEMVKTKAIRLVDELFLECKHRGIKKSVKKSRRAYWECLALYGRLRDEGIAVHQWWG